MSTAVEVAWIGLESAGILMSPEEFDAIEEYDELYGFELIHGVLVVNAIPLEEEADPNEVLGGLLFVYKKQHPLGSALDRTLQERYVYLPHSRRKPDRLIWAGLGRLPDTKNDVPTIVVEFVSAGKRNWKRDYFTKKAEYQELGVQEYWIFNRFSPNMTVHRNAPEGSTELVISEGEIYRTPLLPGFELPFSELLEAADAWNDPA